MADDQIPAAQAVQDTPPAEGTESTEVESQVQAPDQGQETETEATSENQSSEAAKQPEGEAGNQSGQEAKPTRFERRIQKLSEKLKTIGQAQAQQPQITSTESDNKKYFTDEELAEGTVDPNVLIQRIKGSLKEEIRSEVRGELRTEKLQEQYVASVDDFQADLESVKDIDPDLEAEAAAEFEALNYQINPFTGEKEFVPAVKFTEIVNKIQSRAAKLAEKIAQEKLEAQERHLNNVSSTQAVPAGGSVNSASSGVSADTTDFAAFEKSYSR